MDFIRDHRNKQVLRLHEGEVPYLTFPKLDQCDKVEHLFTTREGGVSAGQFRSMNFSVRLGDRPENVLENYELVARILGGRASDVTGTVQTHTVNVRRVTEEDRGKVAFRKEDYSDVDGLVTNEKGIILAVFTADCVPLYFVDPVKEAIGLAHSGWRGTVGNMAGIMVERMKKEFGSDPKDLIVAIGPSICRKCYEVDETVAAKSSDNGKMVNYSDLYSYLWTHDTPHLTESELKGYLGSLVKKGWLDKIDTYYDFEILK